MRVLSISLACVIVLGVSPVRAQNAKAHRAAAERALVKERFCEAVYLYEALDKIDASADNAIAAADAADRADDREKALALYKGVDAKSPRARYVQQQIEAIQKRLASGPGTACQKPKPECGNGYIEAGESCDDGNTLDGDTCARTCTSGVAAPEVKSEPVKIDPKAKPAPKPEPVKPEPVKPEPVKPEPVKPEPVKPEPRPAPALAKIEPVTNGEPSGASDRKLCTLIKPVKWFTKAKWETLDFGTTLSIKSTGPQWTIVQGPSGEGKIKVEAIEGACAAEVASSATVEAMPAAPPPDATPPAAATPAADTPAPAAAPEAAPSTQPAPAVEAQPLAPEHPVVAPVPHEGGGIGIGGLVLLGGGVVVAGAGAAVTAYAALPLLEMRTLTAEQSKLNDDYQHETGGKELADIAYDARRNKTKLDNVTQRWNSQGRFLVIAGGVALTVGVTMMVGGLIWSLAGGGDSE